MKLAPLVFAALMPLLGIACSFEAATHADASGLGASEATSDGGGTMGPEGVPTPRDDAPTAEAGDVSQAIFDSVDKANLVKMLGDATGVNPVSVGGQTLLLKERWSPAAK